MVINPGNVGLLSSVGYSYVYWKKEPLKPCLAALQDKMSR